DNTKAMGELHTALVRANDEASAILPERLGGQVNKTIGNLLEGKASPDEIKRLQKAFQMGRKKPSRGDEILVPEGKTVEEALEFRKAEEIKEGFERGKVEFKMEATRMARDRRNFRMAQ